MTSAGIYVRISDDREGRAVGVRRQEQDARLTAEHHGWEVAAVYSDNDRSATSGRRRPAWERLLADLEAGRIDAVIAFSSSRLYRRPRDLQRLIDLAERQSVRIQTVVSGRIDLSTADGRMIASILASVDQAEAERIGERSRRARSELKQQGVWLGGGHPAFGYERAKGARGKVELRLDPAEATVLREAVDRALAGESLNRIADDFNRRGIRAKHGGRWVPSRLRVTITSPLHAGRFPDGTPGSWPAIITSDEHVLLRARFPRRSGQRIGRSAPLTGLAFCSECGSRLLSSGGAYRCQSRNGGCGRVRVKQSALDEYVDSRVLDVGDGTHGDWLEVGDWFKPHVPGADDTGPLLSELRAVEARQVEARQAFASGELPLADFKGAADALERKIAELERRIREAAPQEPRFDFESDFGRLISEEAFLSVVEDHELIAHYVEKITVSPALRRGPGALADLPDRVSITLREHAR